MQFNWLITFRSVTFAQKAQRVLSGDDIHCQLRRTPKALSRRGCGYCLWLRQTEAVRAVSLLRRQEASFEKVYALDSQGVPEERAL